MRNLIILFVISVFVLSGCGKCYYTEIDSMTHVGEKILIRNKSHNKIMDKSIEYAGKQGYCFVMTCNVPVYHDIADSATIWYYNYPQNEGESIIVSKTTNCGGEIVNSYPTKMNSWLLGLYSLSNAKPSHAYKTSVDGKQLYISQLIRYDNKVVLQNLPMDKSDTLNCTSAFTDSIESHIRQYCM